MAPSPTDERLDELEDRRLEGVRALTEGPDALELLARIAQAGRDVAGRRRAARGHRAARPPQAPREAPERGREAEAEPHRVEARRPERERVRDEAEAERAHRADERERRRAEAEARRLERERARRERAARPPEDPEVRREFYREAQRRLKVRRAAGIASAGRGAPGVRRCMVGGCRKLAGSCPTHSGAAS